MPEKYLYKDKVLQRKEVEDAAKQSGMDIDTYYQKAGLQRVNDNYNFNGKTVPAEEIFEAAKQSKLGFDDYLQKAKIVPIEDVKKKELLSSPSLDGQLPAQNNQVPETVEPIVEDPIAMAFDADRLGKQTVETSVMNELGRREYVPDLDARKQSADKIKELEGKGFKGDFIEAIIDFPQEGFLHPTTSKERLVEVYKENPLKFKQLTNEAKIKYAIKKAALKNANENLPDDENKSYIADQTAIIESNKFSGDNAPPVENMQDWYNVIRGKQQVINDNISDVDERNKLNDMLRQTYASSINPETPTFKEEYEQSPQKGQLDINQYAGLKTLELFEPEKYKQALLILNNKIEPKYFMPVNVTPDDVELRMTTDSATAMKAGGKIADVTVNEQIGKESVLRELNYLGLKNTAEQIASQQHDLIRQYKATDNEEVKNEIAFKLGQTDLKLEEISKSEKQDDERYPLTAQLKFDNQTKEIAQDRGINGASWMYNKYAHSLGTPVDAVENLTTTLFGTDADKAKLSRKRIGETQQFEADTYLPESERRVNSPYILQASKPLKEKVDKILKGRSLSSLSDAERTQLNEVVKNNQDQIETITQAGGSKNFLSKATLMTMAGFTSDIGAFMTQMGLLKGVGMGAKLAEASTLFSTTYGEDFNHQIAEGKSVADANSHAILHGGIMALMVKFGSKFDAVKNILKGGKSPLSKEIAGMTEATWNEIYNRNKSLINRLSGSAKNIAKENAKMIGTFGVVAPVASDIADNVFYNKGKSAQDITEDAFESAKEMAVGSLGFMATGLARGAMKYKANPMEKAAMWDLGDNPDIGKTKIDDAVTKGDLTAQEGEARKKTIDEVSKLIKKVPVVNDKGKPMTDNDRINYLFNLVVKDKATEAAKDLPEKQAEVHELEKLTAEQKNAIMLESPTEAQLEAMKSKAEKSLIPETKEDGTKVEIPQKEIIAAKAEIQAIDEVLGEVKKSEPKDIDTIINDAKESGKLGVFKNMDNDALLKMVAEQAQNIGEKGDNNIRPELADMAMKSTVGQFGQDIVDAAIKKHPAESLLSNTEASKVTDVVVDNPALKDTESITSTESLGSRDMPDFEKESENAKNKAQEKYKNTSNEELNDIFDNGGKEAIDAENELQRRERASIFEVSLKKSGEVLDGLIKQTKEGNDTFSDISELRKAKEVVRVYTEDRGTMADSEILRDFRNSLFGNPKTDYADGLKLRESMNLAAERGIPIEKLLEDVERVFTKDGYHPKLAKKVIIGMLNDVFKGSQKVNEKQIGEQSISNNKEVNEKETAEVLNPEKESSIADKGTDKVSGEAKEGEVRGMYVDPKRTELSHRGLQEIATEMGFDDITSRERKTDLRLVKDAETTIDKWVKEGSYKENIEDLVKKAEDKGVLTDEQRVIVEAEINRVRREVNDMDVAAPNFNTKVKELQRLVKAGEATRSAAGAALRIPTFKANDLSGMMVQEIELNKEAPLTDKQKETVKQEYDEITKAEQTFQEKVLAIEEAEAKSKATKKISEVKSKTTKTKKTHEDFVKERTDISKALKDKLKAARSELNVVPIPYAKELFAIAPEVAKLVKSYVEEGVVKLEEIVKNLHDELKDSIPDIKEKDINDLIAGVYNKKQKTKNELAAIREDLKIQANLVNKLDALLSGEEPKIEKKKILRNQEIEKLKKQIKEVKNFDKDVIEQSDAKRDVDVKNKKEIEKELASSEKEDAAIEKALSELDNPKGKDENKALFDIKKQLAKKIFDIEEQLRSGNFSKPEPKEPLKLDAEAIEAKDRLVHLKNKRALRILKIQHENQSTYEKGVRGVANWLNVPRALMSTFDFSAILRQGIIPTISNPKMGVKAASEMFKSTFSEKNYNRWLYDLGESPRYDLMKESKLAVTDSVSPDLQAKEEAFMTNLVDKVPVLGALTKGSERAYSQFLNKMRVDLFNRFAYSMEQRGLTFKNSPEQYKQMAAYINNATGRGDLGTFMNKAAPLLNVLFFSPRLIASRLNMLTYLAQPRFYRTVPKEVRGAYFKDMGMFIVVGLTVLALAKLNGAEVEDDPRSSDFGKIKSGNTRWDIWGGFQQYARVGTQVLRGETKSSNTGKIYKLNGEGIFAKDRSDPLTSMLRGKLAPVPSIAWDLIKGRNIVGEKIDLTSWESGTKKGKDIIGGGEYAATHLLPLTITGLNEAIKDQGLKGIFTVGLPSIFGIGTQTYSNKNKSQGVAK